MLKSPMPTEKTCPICGVIFYRRETEIASDWRERKTCCRACSNKSISQNKMGHEGYFQWLLDKEGPEAVAAYKEKRKKTYKTTYQRLVDKYGPEKAPEEFEKYKKRMSEKNKGQKCQYDLLVEKHGEEKATEIYNETKTKISKTLLSLGPMEGRFIKKYGEDLGLIKYEEWIGRMAIMRKEYKNKMLEEHGIIEGAFLYNIVRENMSKAQIKYLEEHPESHPYKNVAKFGGRDELTYPEKLLKETLLKNNITNFETNFPMRRYFYDFAFIKEKIDVEVDGPFHLFEERMASDKRRDKFSMDNGWTVMRFTAKKVIENPQLVVDDIMKVISACHNSV